MSLWMQSIDSLRGKGLRRGPQPMRNTKLPRETNRQRSQPPFVLLGRLREKVLGLSRELVPPPHSQGCSIRRQVN